LRNAAGKVVGCVFILQFRDYFFWSNVLALTGDLIIMAPTGKLG
jgi:hypothetical protein